MCIGSNSVNQAQDSVTVTKIKDLPNSLLPSIQDLINRTRDRGQGVFRFWDYKRVQSSNVFRTSIDNTPNIIIIFTTIF